MERDEASDSASLQIAPGRSRSREDERRLVTVLFADVTNSTALGERLDPEELRAVLSSILRTMAEQVAFYGGTVDKYIGDAIMAVFGAPVAHEEDAELALRAALAIREGIERLNDDLEKRHARRLGVRVGVNTGEVVAGVIAREVQSAYTVVGDTVNTAQRLQTAAQPGEILAGPLTHRQTSSLFEFEPVEPLRLKGKADALRAFRLLGGPARLAPTRQRARPGLRSPLIGRERELGAAAQRVDRLLAGEGGAIAILGEAGIGKSRLVAEIEDRAVARGVLWLEGSALSFSQTIGYWPFLQIIRSAAQIGVEDVEEQAWLKLQGTVAVIAPDATAEIVPYLATLLSLRVRGEYEEKVKYLTSDAVGRQVFRAMRLFFERLARRQPLALSFEDLHWLDASSSALLEHLLTLASEAPVLFVGTSRRERDTPAARLREIAPSLLGDRYEEIPLTPLSPSDGSTLVRNLLAVKDLPAAVGERLLAKAEGNPFFLEEITRSLLELGAVTRSEDGSWRATGDLERIVLPDTLRALITARLDRLAEDLNHTLKVASVIGRSFFHRLLRDVVESGVELERALAELEQLELVIERARVPEIEYAFKHALTQEAAYESVLLRRRRELHLRVAGAIERLFSERIDEFYGVLAYHFARAEDWPKAQEYLFKSGDQAVNIAADAEALAHYREAIGAYTRAFGDRWDPLHRAVVERKMAEALFRRGEHEAASEYLRRALNSLGEPLPATPRGVRIALVRELLTQIVNRLFRRGAPIAGENPVSVERRNILEILGWIDYYVDPQRLVLYTLRLMNRSEREGFARGIVNGSFGIGFILDLVGLTGLAEGYHKLTARVARLTDDPIARGYGHLGLAYHSHQIGRWTEAKREWRLAADSFWQAGDVRRWGAASWGVGWLAQASGEWEGARYTGEEMLHVGRDSADPQVTGWAHFILGWNRLQRGDLADAETHLRSSVELLRGVPDLPNMARSQADLAVCLLRMGRLDDALAAVEVSAGLVREHRLRGFLTPVRNAVAEIYLAAADRAEGTARRDWLAQAERAVRAAAKQSRIDREGRPGVLRWDGTTAMLRGEADRARTLWRRSAADAEALGAPYEQALSLWESGRHGESADLARAMEIFTRLGATLPSSAR